MTRDGKRVAAEGDSEDRISGLPRNIIDRILELLPVQDAAKTSILSRNWRYIWVTLPSLVLNYRFGGNFTKESQSNFREVVDHILLLHIGDIVKFVLDARGAHLPSSAAIDRWVLYVTRNGVKTLTLLISNDATYTLPFSIFNCPTLTKLQLFQCVFKPPNPFLGFQNLITLRLQGTTFAPTTSDCVIKAPHLANLSLYLCHGTQYLNIISPGLESLYVRDNHNYLVLNCFVNCKNLITFELETDGGIDNPKHIKKSTLEKLLVSFPALEVLRLGSFFVELLSAHAIPDGLPFTLNCLRRLVLYVDFGNMGPICCTLQLIKNSPNLSELKILVCSSKNNAEAVFKYLDTPSCLERPLEKVEHVAINDFKGSKAELLFVKLLLSRTPSLLRMCISQGKDIDIETASALMRFPRASPRAELLYSQRKAMLTKLFCN